MINEESIEHMTDPDDYTEMENTISELEAEVDALTIAQNKKCADCNLVKQLSTKNAELMSKLNTCSSERERYVEINMEAGLEITELIAKSEQWLNSADQKHIENTKLVAQIDRQKHRIAEMADEITRLNAAMEEATALAAQNVVDC
jgi:uncharacterized small protein (DUF1192 family)